MYREYNITRSSKPIPSRAFDWDFEHEHYDGPEDKRCGNGESIQDCKDKIDELIEEESD